MTGAEDLPDDEDVVDVVDDDDEDDTYAEPLLGSEKTVAECENCGEVIVEALAHGAWVHEDTDEAKCYDVFPPPRRRPS